MNPRRKTGFLSGISEEISGRRRSVAFLIYATIVVVAYALAYLLRFEFDVPASYATLFFVSLGPVVLIRMIVFRAFRLSRQRWRYASTRDVARLVAATAVGSVIVAGCDSMLQHQPRVPLSILTIEPLLTCWLIAGVWLVYRTAFEQLKRRGGVDASHRVLIIGAGEAGNLLAREMLRFPTGYKPLGFIDDDPRTWRSSLHGLDVIGSTVDLEDIVKRYAPDMLIIAIPSAPPAALREIVERCELTGVPFKVLPGIAAVLAGNVALNQLREVRIEDLLGREPIDLHLPELSADLADCDVLITGAAGSIGSELARQVALHAPRTLVVLDQAETPLFFLEIELREAHPDLTIVPVIADIVDAPAIEQVFERFKPDRVFHAAAYKHVPMMELNPREAIRNNVIGTWRVADAAGRHGVERFVLVSTDKAVRPANIMGATKRLAEIIILELQEQFHGTTFGAVRFGNVLGSAGSVIPVFRRQIEKGLPLTVTHPDMTRFFMT
ncbi:MAG TPA: nucleoside-diphosphate sugar epimerase/dehydratase, partial [Longimicrobiales bacterium]